MSVNAKGQGVGLWADAGDTAFTRSNSKLGAAIRWGETDPDEKGTDGAWANHQLVVTGSGWLVPPEGLDLGTTAPRVGLTSSGANLAVIVEAMWHVQRDAWWALHAKDYAGGMRIRVFRPIPRYDAAELARFVAHADAGVGQRYGWWKLLGFLAKRATGVNVPAMFFVEGRPICSYYAALANEEARPVGTPMPGPACSGGQLFRWPGFGMPAKEADPDEAMDFCVANEGKWWREVWA